MKQYKAYKFRLYPNLIQQQYFVKCFGAVRFLYNKMLEERKQAFLNQQYDYTKFKTYTDYKKEYDWLYEIDNFALANAQLNLITAFRNFFSHQKNFPRFKSKHSGRDIYTTNNVHKNFRIERDKIFIPKIGFVKVVQHRQIPPNENIKSYKISKTKTDKYFITIIVQQPSNEKQVFVDVNKSIGLDYSNSAFYIDSQNVKANYPQFYCSNEKKIKKIQKQLSLCVFQSKNWIKLKKKLALIYEKNNNCRKDWLEKLSCQLAKQYDIICLETLDMCQMSQNLNLGKKLMDNSWGLFVSMLKRKCKKIVKVDKWFPSSKLCSKCGYINEKLTLNDREWRCQCGALLNRDYNAAINILNEGKRLLSL